MLSETPATTATSLSPLGVLTLPAMSGGKRLCICRGWLSSLTFHSSFISFTLSFVRIVSFRCHAVRCGSPPSVSQSVFWVCAPGAAIHVAAAPYATIAASHRRFIRALPSGAFYQKRRGIPTRFWDDPSVLFCEMDVGSELPRFVMVTCERTAPSNRRCLLRGETFTPAGKGRVGVVLVLVVAAVFVVHLSGAPGLSVVSFVSFMVLQR